LVPENVAATALDDAFCEEIAVQPIIDVQSYRIAAYIASKILVSIDFGLFRQNLNACNHRPATGGEAGC